MRWTAAEVIGALREAYGVARSNLVTDEWSLLTEVPLRSRQGWGTNQRHIDVLLVRNWSSGCGHRRIAVEVKVSRGDFRNETDEKRAPAEECAHQTYYAAPAGVIRARDLPAGWGLIEVHQTRGQALQATGAVVGDGTVSRCTYRRKAAERVPRTDEYLVAAVARQASRFAEMMRRGEGDVVEVVNLRAEVDRLRDALARRTEAVARAEDRVGEMRRLLAAADGMQDCADCSQPVLYRPARGAWTHAHRGDEAACLVLRQDRVRRRREAATGAAYLRGPADPVEPIAVRRIRDGDTGTLSGVDSTA